MKKLTIQQLKDKVHLKKIKGDYILLGKMLGIDGDAARKQYARSKSEAVVAIYIIIRNREKLIKNAAQKIKEFIDSKIK